MEVLSTTTRKQELNKSVVVMIRKACFGTWSLHVLQTPGTELVFLLTVQRADHSVLTMARQAGIERLAMKDMRCVSAVMLLLGVANKVCV